MPGKMPILQKKNSKIQIACPEAKRFDFKGGGENPRDEKNAKRCKKKPRRPEG